MMCRQQPHYEIWCQQNTNIVTKSLPKALVIMALIISTFGAETITQSTTTINNNNNSKNNTGAINESTAFETFLNDDVNQIGLLSTDNIVQRHTVSSVTSINDTIDVPAPKRSTASTAITTDEEITSSDTGSANAMLQTSEFVAPNTRRDITTVAHTPPITTNRPFISTFSDTARHKVVHSRQYQSKHHHEHHLGPFFEGPLNTTAGALHVGIHLYTEAVLNCRVGMLKDKTVMWVRRTSDKFSLLTVGNITYSGDPRIKITFQYPNNWRLHINPLMKEDGGLYMCQVSTHPPRVFATNVTVLPPAIRVVDEQGNEIRDRYYKIGSTIDLTCQVAATFIKNNTANAPEPNILLQHHYYQQQQQQQHYFTLPSVKENEIDVPEKAKTTATGDDVLYKKIIWKKDGENVTKDALFNLSSNGGWLISRLSILSAERSHSGIYSCSIINSTSATVDVQILNGETPAAVQHSAANQFSYIHHNIQLIAFIIMVLYISC